MIAARVETDDETTAPPEQLDQPEVVVVPSVGKVGEAVAAVVDAEHLLQRIANVAVVHGDSAITFRRRATGL